MGERETGGITLSEEMIGLKNLLECFPWKAFYQIKRLIRSFPKFDNSVVLDKERTRVACFGEKGARVEMQLDVRRVVFTFHDLNSEDLERHCTNDTLDMVNFARCFSCARDRKGQNRLILGISLDKNEIQMDAKIMRWNSETRTIIDSLPYLEGAKYSEQLKRLLGDYKELLPYFLSQLRKRPEVSWSIPESRSREEKRDEICTGLDEIAPPESIEAETVKEEKKVVTSRKYQKMKKEHAELVRVKKAKKKKAKSKR